ncbi:MAG: DNA repair protein RecN [Deltaproteobacteria bacterium]|nr:MAG: DNA repair protein RecN [Deltaproteobacteria bacterium]
MGTLNYCWSELPLLADLQIHNFAIIDELSVSFRAGLTVITGETGAGKSILVNAINLVLGSRGSVDLIRSGSQEATVTALFRPAEEKCSIDTQGISNQSGGPELLVSRTLAATGRNRVYVNGQLSTVGTLSGLCRGLVSISGQHEHQLFLEPESHLAILDRFGGLEKRREDYGQLFDQLTQLKVELRMLRQQAQEHQEKEELRRFQLEEINSARVQMDEELQLGEERDRLRHAERLQRDAGKAHHILYADSGAVLEEVSRCHKLIADLVQLDNTLRPLAEALEGIRHQAEDVAVTLRDYNQKIQADPARLQWVEERLHTLDRLMRKYGGSTQAVLAQADKLQQELEAGESEEIEIGAKEESLEQVRRQALTEALELSKARRKTAARLTKAVEKSLVSLDMPHCRFSVFFDQDKGVDAECIPVGEYLLDRRGLDRVAFFFSANPGEEPRPMAKIASGGELSRIILGLKELLAWETMNDALIFDEVDAGIGGGTADRVGQRLKALSERHQVICITHLPQIACYGDHHYVVSKSTRKGRTITGMMEVGGEERVEEIARMLGGAIISQKTRAHAREMLKQAENVS